MEIVNSCFDQQDTTSQIHIIQVLFKSLCYFTRKKVLLLVVTTPCCDIHDNALMAVVRTTYNVYLVNVAEVNRTTAKTILQQMLSHVFHLFEVEVGQKQGCSNATSTTIEPPTDSEGKVDSPAEEIQPEESTSTSTTDFPTEQAVPLSVIIATEILDDIISKIPVFFRVPILCSSHSGFYK